MSKRLNIPVECVVDARNTTGESPLWSAREAALYWVDIPDGAIYRWRPATGEQRTWRLPAAVGSIGLREGGGLVVAMRTGFHLFDTGSCLPRPTDFRQLSTWFGHDDFFHMIDQCLKVPAVGYLAVWGISNNTRKYWSFGEDEERLGYVPKQDSEIYAAEILKQKNPLDPIAQRYQGGGFVTIDFTPMEKR
jgi:hypothetical protein